MEPSRGCCIAAGERSTLGASARAATASIVEVFYVTRRKHLQGISAPESERATASSCRTLQQSSHASYEHSKNSIVRRGMRLQRDAFSICCALLSRRHKRLRCARDIVRASVNCHPLRMQVFACVASGQLMWFAPALWSCLTMRYTARLHCPSVRWVSAPCASPMRSFTGLAMHCVASVCSASTLRSIA